jgi:hypothetical protein
MSYTLIPRTLFTAVTTALTKSLPDVRRGLTERCASILHAYRKHCAAGQNSGQVGYYMLRILRNLC